MKPVKDNSVLEIVLIIDALVPLPPMQAEGVETEYYHVVGNRVELRE